MFLNQITVMVTSHQPLAFPIEHGMLYAGMGVFWESYDLIQNYGNHCIGIVTQAEAYGGRTSLPLSSYNNWTSGKILEDIDNECDITDTTDI